MPTATVVTVESETVHTAGESERNDTVSPVCLGGSVMVIDEAVNVTGWPTAVSCGWSKMIVCWLVPACARNERRIDWAGA